MVMYSYKIFRLVIIVLMITYLVGCIWWLSVTNLNSEGATKTYVTFFEMDQLYVKEGMDGMCGWPVCTPDSVSLEEEERPRLGDGETPADKAPEAENGELGASSSLEEISTADVGLQCRSQEWKAEHCEQDVITLVIIQCYFALTTLSTIGYGDLYPVTIPEMFVGIIFMLVGIVFFS